MTSLLYSFREAPTYRGASPTETFEAALDMPLSLTSTFFDQAKGGILESFGLGTAIRDITIPEGKTEPRGALDILSPHPLLKTYDLTKRAMQSFINDEDSPALSEDAYKSSAWYREGVQWDAAMTEQRAAALAESFDARKVREFYASKRPITAFIANLAGQAADPINYVPVAGPVVRAASIARLGKVGGASVAASLDAAANTAIFGVATARTRARFGDDVSWQTTVSQIATAALIGAGFGAIGGALDRSPTVSRSAIEERLATLKTTQEARIALNEGIDALVHGEDIRLSPNAVEPVGRITQSIEPSRATTVPLVARADGSTPDASIALSRPIVYDPSIAREMPEEVGVAFHGSPFAAKIKDIRPSEGGELGAGLYISREPKIAAGYARNGDVSPTEGVVAIDVSRANLKDVTRAEYLAERARLYDEEQAKAGGEWSRDVAIAGDKRLIDFYQSQGFDGIYDVQGRQGVIFPERLSSVALKVQTANSDKLRQTPTIDTTAARPEPPPDGIKEAEKAIAKPDDYKALANQYRVDPDTGTFAEEADIAQLGIEGRLLDEDIATLAEAQDAYDNGAAYGEALKSVVGCLL